MALRIYHHGHYATNYQIDGRKAIAHQTNCDPEPWFATFEDYEGGQPVGTGKTAEAAFRDLAQWAGLELDDQ